MIIYFEQELCILIILGFLSWYLHCSIPLCLQVTNGNLVSLHDMSALVFYSIRKIPGENFSATSSNSECFLILKEDMSFPLHFFFFFCQYDQHLFRGKQPPIIAHNKITHTHTHIFLQTNKTHFQSLSCAKYDVRPSTDWQGYTTTLKVTNFALFTILSCPDPSKNLITFKFVLVYRLPFIPLFGLLSAYCWFHNNGAVQDVC